jgi:general stress protein 26
MTTELPVPIEDWQEDFDEWFPKGAVVIRMSDDPDGDDPTYTTPQITAVQMIGELPQIYWVAGYSKGFLLTLVSWKQAHEEPLVFAAADTDGQLWRFSNSISDKLAAVLAVNRGDEVLSRVYVLAMIS